VKFLGWPVDKGKVLARVMYILLKNCVRNVENNKKNEEVQKSEGTSTGRA